MIMMLTAQLYTVLYSYLYYNILLLLIIIIIVVVVVVVTDTITITATATAVIIKRTGINSIPPTSKTGTRAKQSKGNY